MRQRDLELLLERVPTHPRPRADLEQYGTPATLAADLLFRAHALGDISGASVLDLGTGTGVFAVGAALMGAERVLGVDVDAAALVEAERAAGALGVAERVTFEESDVCDWKAAERFDTALQNPPFGAQKRGADRPFLDAALSASQVTYTMHLTETGEFVIAYASERGARLTHAWDYSFPLRHQFRFQERAVRRVPVTVFRFES